MASALVIKFVERDGRVIVKVKDDKGLKNRFINWAWLISNHQERFVAMLNEPEPEAEGEQEDQAGGSNYIQVTPSEKMAIDRLKALGFPEVLCIQAYFACDKNEELAANFLLQQAQDD